jgi:amino acid adenylation domain-containing protein
MLADSQASMVITTTHLAATLSTDHVKLVLLDADAEAIQRQPDTNPEVLTSPNDLAYTIYTSGSTGKPKGVAIEHRQILNRLAWMWDAYPFGPGEVACQKTALGFVDSLWELLGGLLQGNPTVIIPDGVVRDPQGLVKALAEHRVTRLWVVPSLLRAVLDSHSDLQRTLPALTFWVTTGEAITADLVQRFGEALPHAVLYNVYGTSEVWDVTWYEPNGAVPSPFPIGRPISNMQTYILDPDHQPVPIGVMGERYVGGVGLGRGYLNQARLTSERFIPHPFSPVPGQRLYRTGDLARFLPDGTIEYLGRADHQLKIRGFRVEPGEIEAVLKQHPGVDQAVVVAREAGLGDVRLAAYYVAAQDSAPPANELHRWLQGSLPDYMVPAHYMRLEALPLTPSGKINRLALPDPGKEQPFSRPSPTAPRNALEEVLAAVFAEILGLEDVGIDDDFFADLGGHSLLATRLVSQICDLFETHIPLLRFFEAPTVAGFAVAMIQDEAERRRVEKTAELLLRLSQMADDEVQAMLSERAGRQSDLEAQ